jgi:Tol biopolymer transport system component
VEWADWSPDGTTLAVVHEVDGRKRLEFPLGKVIYEADGWIGNLRVAPKGDLLAFIDHPQPRDDGGSVAIVDLAGKKKTLSEGWDSIQGLAWSPKGDEVWFSATRTGGDRSLFAVNLSGNVRLLARVPGELTLLDVSRDGTVLLTRGNDRAGMIGLAPGESKERDFSIGPFPPAFRPTEAKFFFRKPAKAADQNMPSTYARPMALQRSASAKAAASPCRPMANGRWPG